MAEWQTEMLVLDDAKLLVSGGTPAKTYGAQMHVCAPAPLPAQFVEITTQSKNRRIESPVWQLPGLISI